MRSSRTRTLHATCLGWAALWLSACAAEDDALVRGRIGSIDHLAQSIISASVEEGQWLTEIVAVLPAPARTVVVDRTSPHIRVFSTDGELIVTGGRSGSGPAELESPWRAATNADTLFVIQSGQLMSLDLETLSELRRAPAPPGVISLHPSCGEHSVFVVAGQEVTADGAVRLSHLALARTVNGTILLPEGHSPAQFAPVGHNLVAVQVGDTLTFLDPFRKAVEQTLCNGVPIFSQPLGILKESPVVPVLRGAAAGGGAFLFFLRAPREGREVTRALVWREGSVLADRLIDGDLRLHPGTEQEAWVIENGLRPRILRVPMVDLVNLLLR